MRVHNQDLLEGQTEDMESNFTLPPIWLGHIAYYSIQLVFAGGTPDGTFKLQASNDPGNQDKSSGGWDTSSMTNWTDIADSAQAVTSAGNHMWSVENAGYLWVRVVWTDSATSGTSLTSARAYVKGV